MSVRNLPSSPPSVAQLLVLGHSRVAEGQASTEDFGVSHKTARRLGAQLSLAAQGGSCLAMSEGATIAGSARYGGVGRLLQFVNSSRTAAPYLPAWQATVLDFGLNDMGWMGPSTFQSVFPLALRGALARLRMGRCIEDSDGLVTYTGASWSSVGLTSCNSGTSVHQVTANGDSFSIPIPADYPGTPISLRFLTGAAGQGALWTITGTGSCAGVNTTYDSRNINGFDNGGTRGANGKLLSSVKRLTALANGLTAGSGTLNGVATTIGTTGYFDCLEWESPYPGPIAAGMDCRPAAYTLWSTWPYPGIGDTDVATIWAIVGSVAREFDPTVFGLPTDGVFNKNPAYFAADGAHWNDLGHALAADRVATLFAQSTNPLQLTTSGGFFEPYFYPLDGTGAGNAFQNSWTNFGSGLEAGGYRKDNLSGRVQINGVVTKTTGNATDVIFTLPVGYRPLNTTDFEVAVFNGSTWGTGTLRVTSAGNVNLTSGGSIAAGNANEMNCSFQGEQ